MAKLRSVAQQAAKAAKAAIGGREYTSVYELVGTSTVATAEMDAAMELWSNLYQDRAPWLTENVHSLNLAAFISREIAISTTLEMKVSVAGSPRATWLDEQLVKLRRQLRRKLEQGQAVGGMVIKPYVRNNALFFDFTMQPQIYPISFDDNGRLDHVVFVDTFTVDDVIFSRVEEHRHLGNEVRITNRAFRTQTEGVLGKEVALESIDRWKDVAPEAVVQNMAQQLFGYYRVPLANSVDIDSPLGVSIFSKAVKLIERADRQYSSLLWEFEGGELAIDVDPTALQLTNREGVLSGGTMPRLNKRLFRALDTGDDKAYHVFNPTFRDASLLNGLNMLLMRIEDQVGLARGTLVDATAIARTATEMRQLKQRTFATIDDNQQELQACLEEVLYAADTFATLYNLAPAGKYELNIEWGDSILTDREKEYTERTELISIDASDAVEMRMWYFGEDKVTATARVEEIKAAQPDPLKELVASPTGESRVQPPLKVEEPEEEPPTGGEDA